MPFFSAYFMLYLVFGCMFDKSTSSVGMMSKRMLYFEKVFLFDGVQAFFKMSSFSLKSSSSVVTFGQSKLIAITFSFNKISSRILKFISFGFTLGEYP